MKPTKNPTNFSSGSVNKIYREMDDSEPHECEYCTEPHNGVYKHTVDFFGFDFSVWLCEDCVDDFEKLCKENGYIIEVLN